MPIDFPNSPSVNDTFTSGATTWIWTGTVWNTVTTAVGATGPTGPAGAAGATGPTGPSAITTQGDLAIGDASGIPTRLGIGTNGQVLSSNGTTASWQTPSVGAENWTVLAGFLNLSGSSTNITGFAARNKYMLVLNSVGSSTAQDVINIRFNNDTGNNYYIWEYRIQVGSSYGTGNFLGWNNQDTRIPMISLANNINSRGAASIMIFGAKSSGQKVIEYNGGADNGGGNNFILRQGMARYDSASAITSIQVFTGGGTMGAGNYMLLGAD